MAGAERVFALLDTPPDWQDAPGATPLGDAAFAGGVELRGVDFAYEPGRPVLHDVSPTVPAGQHAWRWSAHGQRQEHARQPGRPSSTCRRRGQLLIDGRDLRGVTGASLRRHIACVTQDNFLFSGTVMDNIRVGRADASDDEVRAAARALDVERA